MSILSYDDAIESAAINDTKFCLQKQDDRSVLLDHARAYYC